MDERIIECVPNFSEGRNKNTIEAIAEAIRSVDGVRLLDVDAGYTANRTVYTFVGDPESVGDAAFLAIQKAVELIDMRNQKGEHPRIGAADVCPFVPVRNVTLQDCMRVARIVAQRVGLELGVPVYCYGDAAFASNRADLAACRKGQYEGLRQKMEDPDWRPDFGPFEYDQAVERSGAAVIGARPYLIAVNFNLDTRSVKIANEIARTLRESGSKGQPGRLKCCKAIGWYIEEYGIAQVSMNLTNMDVTPLHVAYEAVCEEARRHSQFVTGTEIIGLVPKQALVDAGHYFMSKRGWDVGDSDDMVMYSAIRQLGLDNLKPFKPSKKVIECMI